MTFKYCPLCARELTQTPTYSMCLSCKENYYRNSKATASVCIVEGDEVLLSKRGRDPYIGSLDIIGGFLEYGESPEDGAKREVLEETGLTVELVSMLGIYMGEYGEGGPKTLNIHYIGRSVGGTMLAADDAASLHWVKIASLDPKNIFKDTILALTELRNRWFEGERTRMKWYKSIRIEVARRKWGVGRRWVDTVLDF